MHFLKTSLAALACTALVAVPAWGEIADKPHEATKTAQEVVSETSLTTATENAKFLGHIVIADATGFKTIDVTNSSFNLPELLVNSGYDPTLYRGEDGKVLPSSIALQPNDTLFIFKQEVATTFAKITLPIPEEEVKSTLLAKGSTIVLSEGQAGSALRTIVKTTDYSKTSFNGKRQGSKAVQVIENLAIVASPLARKIIVGTNTNPDALKSAGLIYSAGTTLTSPFGLRVHPVTHVYKLHDGDDFAAACGTPIEAASGGQVVGAAMKAGYGNQIIIDHGAGFKTSYSHLSRMAVKVGDVVAQGTVIGEAGATGYATGCHLHFMIYVNDKPVDPLPILEENK